MRSLIVEDEFTSRMQIKHFLEEFGECDIAVNGTEAVEAFKMSIDSKKPYDLICLDIKLPEKDGHKVLEEIRKIEENLDSQNLKSPKIFMTTALGDIKNVKDAYFQLCDEYLVKPIEKGRLVEKLIEHSLISVVRKN
jgi:two-component system, chemotaxis family, chemotaxis protein CheY